MKRLEFSRKVKLARYEFSGAKCEAVWEGKRCDAPLTPGKTEYHHEIEAEAGGDNSFENCRCVDSACHKILTAMFVKGIRKADRQKSAHLNARKAPSRKMQSRDFTPSEKAAARAAAREARGERIVARGPTAISRRFV